MRARLVQTQAHLCPCEQNPSTTREITVEPRPGGGLLTVKLYEGHVRVELVVVAVNGKLPVSDEPAKGSLELGTIVFQEKPTPTPTSVSPSSGARARILNVPWYHQAFELSCESASLRMAGLRRDRHNRRRHPEYRRRRSATRGLRRQRDALGRSFVTLTPDPASTRSPWLGWIRAGC
jgi:hypothetical protein